MAQNEIVKRYLDAGANFTELTQRRAEAIVKDLVKTGEVQAEQAQQAVQDLLDRSRRSTEKFLELVRHEVRAQVASLGLASKKELARLEKRIDSLKPKPAAKKAPAKKAAGQEGSRQEDRGQEDRGQEGAGQEGGREEGPRQEGTGQEGRGQEGARQEDRRQVGPTATRRRLDAELVRRGLVDSREQARLAVAAGRVLVGGASADKPARLVAPGEPIELIGPGPRFVVARR